jgi:hypothetical protein
MKAKKPPSVLSIALFSLTIVFAVSAAALGQEKIQILTGPLDGAGTDANIDLTIGTKTVRLNSLISGNAFEKNNTDTVVWPEALPGGDILSIRVKSDNAGLGSDWFLNRIVFKGSTGKSVAYSCYCWINSSTPSVDIRLDNGGNHYIIFNPELQAIGQATFGPKGYFDGSPRYPVAGLSTFNRDGDIQIGVILPGAGWLIPVWNLTAVDNRTQIKFSNGEFWAVPFAWNKPVEADWAVYAPNGSKMTKRASIRAKGNIGADLNIWNYNLDRPSSRGVSIVDLTIRDRDRRLTGTVADDYKRIQWSDGYVWVYQGPVTPENTAGPNTPTNPPTPVGGPLKLPGMARDIDAKNGSVWIIGTEASPGGYRILHLVNGNWTAIDGAAVRVAVDTTGNPWVINSNGTIYRRVNNAWQVLASLGGAIPTDIAITNSGDVWVITDGGSVSRLTAAGPSGGLGLGAVKIFYLSDSDTLGIVDVNGKIWIRESATSWVIKPDAAAGLAGKYVDFAVDGDGTKWGIDAQQNIWKLGKL